MNYLNPSMMLQVSRKACGLCNQEWLHKSMLFLASVPVFIVSGISSYSSWWTAQIRHQLFLEAFLELCFLLLTHLQRLLYFFTILYICLSLTYSIEFWIAVSLSSPRYQLLPAQETRLSSRVSLRVGTQLSHECFWLKIVLTLLQSSASVNYEFTYFRILVLWHFLGRWLSVFHISFP